MIGIIGDPRRDGKSSFRTLIAYCREREGVAHTGIRNIIFTDIAAAEMESVALQNTCYKDPLMHITLSWRELELPTNAQIDEAVGIALTELDLQDCQAVWIARSDTENRHVHIVANRIDPETYTAIQPVGRWTHQAIQRAARSFYAARYSPDHEEERLREIDQLFNNVRLIELSIEHLSGKEAIELVRARG